MRLIDPLALGGTLFLSATHKNLFTVVLERRYEELRSVVIDTEDGLDADSLNAALQKIQTLLDHLQPSPLYIFLRPRDSTALAAFLEMRGIERIDGFVLPKFSHANAGAYLSLLSQTQHSFMPSFEGEELFDTAKLIALKELLLPYKSRIVLVRFGLEDMLRLLGIRKSCKESIFDFAAPNAALGAFIGIFKSSGFLVSGGVYGCYRDEEGFAADLKRDLKEGLFTKTIIHPNQIAPTHKLYQVSREEFDEAKKILNAKSAVFALDGKMGEKSTMQSYAQFIHRRAKIYGVREN